MTKDQAIRKAVVAHERRATARLQLIDALNEARDAGASLRELATALKMSHAGIAKILRSKPE